MNGGIGKGDKVLHLNLDDVALAKAGEAGDRARGV